MSRNGSARLAYRRFTRAADRRSIEVEWSASDADQTAADADQTASDGDQSASDADQTAAERDEADAVRDQRAADDDQMIADEHPPADGDGVARVAYEVSRRAREMTTVSRLTTNVARGRTARLRAETATGRDAIAAMRDAAAERRDRRAEAVERAIAASDAPLAEKLEMLRARAAADRTRAAADRARAAQDRADATRERARLEAELHSAHLDDLTGAFRREVGTLALRHEVARALRADGRFVIAFVDVDGLKRVNDLDGHAAGDHVLKTLVWTMRSNLRSFDPVIRYGGDEFVCGLGGVDPDDVERRFDAIGRSVRNEVGVGISVGVASLAAGETLDHLTARADAALLDAKQRRRG